MTSFVCGNPRRCFCIHSVRVNPRFCKCGVTSYYLTVSEPEGSVLRQAGHRGKGRGSRRKNAECTHCLNASDLASEQILHHPYGFRMTPGGGGKQAGKGPIIEGYLTSSVRLTPATFSIGEGFWETVRRHISRMELEMISERTAEACPAALGQPRRCRPATLTLAVLRVSAHCRPASPAAGVARLCAHGEGTAVRREMRSPRHTFRSDQIPQGICSATYRRYISLRLRRNFTRAAHLTPKAFHCRSGAGEAS